MHNTLPIPSHVDINPDMNVTPAERMLPNPHMKVTNGEVNLVPSIEKPYIDALNAEIKAMKEGVDPQALPIYNTSVTARTEALGRVTDPLTGLLNREGVTEWFERNRPEKFAIFFADGDEFGKINKQHGHKVGDEVIRFIGDSVSSKLRTGIIPASEEEKLTHKERLHPEDRDIVGVTDAGVGRVGGDEFVFIVDLTHAVEGDEQRVLDLISSRVNQKSEYTSSDGKKIEVRISAAGMIGRASDGRGVDSYKDELDKELQPEKHGRKAAKEVIRLAREEIDDKLASLR